MHDHPRILRRSVNTQLRPIEELLRSLYGDDMFKEVSMVSFIVDDFLFSCSSWCEVAAACWIIRDC